MNELISGKSLLAIYGFIAGMQEKAAQDAINNLQQSLDYCREENRVLKEQLLKVPGKKRIILNDSQRRRLASFFCF